MAAHATSLRIDMNKTFEVAEKVFNPEGAIEMAAALQRSGVTQSSLLDPLKLMDLSRNDPAELQRQIAELSKSFVTLNKDGRFEIMSGSQGRLREIAKELNMTAGDLAKMGIAAKEVEDKMTKIKFPDTITEEQKQFFANMAEMNENGEYVIRYDGKTQDVNTLIAELSTDKSKMDKFLADTKPKTMEDLAREQLDATKAIPAAINSLKSRTGYAIAGSEIGEQTLEATIKTNNAAVDSLKLDIKDIKKTYSDSMVGVLDGLTKSLKGESGVEGVFVALGEATKKTQELLNTTFKNSIEEASKQLDKLKIEGDKNSLLGLITGIGESFKKNENLGTQTVNTTQTNANTNSSMLNQAINSTQGNTNTTTTNGTTTPLEQKIDLKITLDAPSHIDTSQLTNVLNDPSFQQELIKALEKSSTNNGQTPNASYPIKK